MFIQYVSINHTVFEKWHMWVWDTYILDVWYTKKPYGCEPLSPFRERAYSYTEVLEAFSKPGILLPWNIHIYLPFFPLNYLIYWILPLPKALEVEYNSEVEVKAFCVCAHVQARELPTKLYLKEFLNMYLIYSSYIWSEKWWEDTSVFC